MGLDVMNDATPDERRAMAPQKTVQRYDLVTNYRCGTTIEEMERSDDGEWVRYEDVEAALLELKELAIARESALASLLEVRTPQVDALRALMSYVQHKRTCNIGLCATCDSHAMHAELLARGECQSLPCDCGLASLLEVRTPQTCWHPKGCGDRSCGFCYEPVRSTSIWQKGE